MLHLLSSRRERRLGVLVFDGKSVYTPSVLRCLAEVPNIRIGVLSKNGTAPSRASRYCSYFGVIDRSDPVASLEETAREKHFDVVLPTDENAVRLLAINQARLRRSLCLHPVATPEAINICTDKWLTAEFLRAHNVPAPLSMLYTPETELEMMGLAGNGPVLVKPRIGSNGEDIRHFSGSSEAIRWIASGTARPSQYMMQCFVDGYDIDCSVLCVEGEIEAYTIQRTRIAGARRFGPAAGIEFVNDQGPLEVVRPVLRALRWNGIMHIDLRYDSRSRDYKLIEMNPRYWGSLLGSLAAGINFPVLACQIAQGIRPEPVRQRCGFYLSLGGMARETARRVLGRRAARFSMRETALRYVWSDPLPQFERLFRLIQ